jgi:hypothetical protein
MSSEEPKLPKHHYIPFFYLSQWTKDGRFVEFSRPPGRTQVEPRATSPKGTGYQRGLYRLTGVPEEVAETVERKFMSQVDNLAKDALDILLGDVWFDWTLKTHSAWSRFVNGLLFRTPERVFAARRYLEDHWLEKYDERLEDYNRIKGPNDLDFIDFIVRATERGSIQFTMKQMDDVRIGTQLNQMRCHTIDVPPVGRPLFTSDRPIIMTNGLAHTHSHLVMPISPTRLFLATNNEEEEQKLRAIPRRELVKLCNRNVIRRAQRYAWNTRDSELAFVRKHLSAEAELDRSCFSAPPNRGPLAEENAV